MFFIFFNVHQKAYEPRRLFKQKEDFVKDESNKFIGTVLEYEAPFEAVKNTTITESKSSKNESNNEKNEKVLFIINASLLIYPFEIY